MNDFYTFILETLPKLLDGLTEQLRRNIKTSAELTDKISNVEDLQTRLELLETKTAHPQDLAARIATLEAKAKANPFFDLQP